MEFRHSTIHNLFKQLDQRVNQYLNKKSEECLEENNDDPNAFFDCMNNSTSSLRENYYKFENLSLYSDLREKECSQDATDYQQCIDKTAKDLTTSMNDLMSSLE